MAWKPGPLPPNTWNWGAVVLTEQPSPGFYFADFCGDRAKIVPGGQIVPADEVHLYDNSIELPDGKGARKEGV